MPRERYDLTWPWIALASLCLFAALWQWLEVAGHLWVCAVEVWRCGLEQPLISAGSTMIAVFFAASAACIGLAGIARVFLRQEESRWQRCAGAAVVMLTTGAILWGGLLCSPLIKVVRR
jgi:hypothetical protein